MENHEGEIGGIRDIAAHSVAPRFIYYDREYDLIRFKYDKPPNIYFSFDGKGNLVAADSFPHK